MPESADRPRSIAALLEATHYAEQRLEAMRHAQLTHTRGATWDHLSELANMEDDIGRALRQLPAGPRRAELSAVYDLVSVALIGRPAYLAEGAPAWGEFLRQLVQAVREDRLADIGELYKTLYEANGDLTPDAVQSSKMLATAWQVLDGPGEPLVLPDDLARESTQVPSPAPGPPRPGIPAADARRTGGRSGLTP